MNLDMNICWFVVSELTSNLLSVRRLRVKAVSDKDTCKCNVPKGTG